LFGKFQQQGGIRNLEKDKNGITTLNEQDLIGVFKAVLFTERKKVQEGEKGETVRTKPSECDY
jgi:hypothetical protein